MQKRIEIIRSMKKPSFSNIRLQLILAINVKDINTRGNIPFISLAMIACRAERHHAAK